MHVDPHLSRVDECKSTVSQILNEPVHGFLGWNMQLSPMHQVVNFTLLVSIAFAWIPLLTYRRRLQAWRRVASTHSQRLYEAQYRLAEAESVEDIMRRMRLSSASLVEVQFATECLERWTDEVLESAKTTLAEYVHSNHTLEEECEEPEFFLGLTPQEPEGTERSAGSFGGETLAFGGRANSSAQSGSVVDEHVSCVRIYRGAWSGSAMLTLVGRHVFNGMAVMGYPIYTIEGNQLFGGKSDRGNPLATLSGNKVFEGSSVSGVPMATLSGDKAFAGKAVAGAILVSTSQQDPKALLAGAYHALA